jgi:hypothetical protein
MKRKKKMSTAEAVRLIADAAAAKAADPKLAPELRAVAAEIHASWIKHCTLYGLGYAFKDN